MKTITPGTPDVASALGLPRDLFIFLICWGIYQIIFSSMVPSYHSEVLDQTYIEGRAIYGITDTTASSFQFRGFHTTEEEKKSWGTEVPECHCCYIAESRHLLHPCRCSGFSVRALAAEALHSVCCLYLCGITREKSGRWQKIILCCAKKYCEESPVSI